MDSVRIKNTSQFLTDMTDFNSEMQRMEREHKRTNQDAVTQLSRDIDKCTRKYTREIEDTHSKHLTQIEELNSNVFTFFTFWKIPNMERRHNDALNEMRCKCRRDIEDMQTKYKIEKEEREAKFKCVMEEAHAKHKHLPVAHVVCKVCEVVQ